MRILCHCFISQVEAMEDFAFFEEGSHVDINSPCHLILTHRRVQKLNLTLLALDSTVFVRIEVRLTLELQV